MTRAQLEALAARVEAAQGADRWLDAEIFAAVKGNGWKAQEPGVCHRNTLSWGSYQSTGVPRFTEVVGDAIGLVPRGHDWSVAHVGGKATACVVRVMEDARDAIYAATPARALTAAALRARAMEASDAE